MLALVSKPHAMSAAPIRPEPRYPAGRVSQGIPPDMLVAPPSSAVRMRIPASESSSKRGLDERESGKMLTIELDGMDARACEDAYECVAHLLRKKKLLA